MFGTDQEVLAERSKPKWLNLKGWLIAGRAAPQYGTLENMYRLARLSGGSTRVH